MKEQEGHSSAIKSQKLVAKEQHDLPCSGSTEFEKKKTLYSVPCIHKKFFPMFEVFKPGDALKQIMKNNMLMNFKAINLKNTYIAFFDNETYILTFEEKNELVEGRSAESLSSLIDDKVLGLQFEVFSMQNPTRQEALEFFSKKIIEAMIPDIRMILATLSSKDVLRISERTHEFLLSQTETLVCFVFP